MKKTILYLLLAFVAASCHLTEEEAPVDEIVAKVNDKYLYKKDLGRILRQEVSPQDSIVLVKNYIDNWVKEQLLLTKAELNLTDEEKDVQEKLNSYRNSLIIYRYQERYIKENLDTVIRYEDVKDYYEENTPNFLLDNNLVKAIYIKLSKDIPRNEVYQMVRWLKSNSEEDHRELFNYCMQNAENFDDFNKNWVVFNMIQLQFPRKINNPERTLKWNKFFEANDTTYYYYLKIEDFVPKSEVAPIDYIEDNIRNIIINKRKIELIETLEKDLMNDALNRDLVKIYQN